MKFLLSLIAVASIAEAHGSNWKSGAIQSYEKFQYGKFRAQVKAPDRKGTVASFYTYWDGPGFYPGGWNEIDMNIVPSASSSDLSLNAIYGDGHNKIEDHDYANDWHIGDTWHTYEMEWTPNHITYSIDGRNVRRIDNDDHEAVKFMHKPQTLRMNFWTPTFHAWGADFNPVDMPWYLLVDYIEVYKYNQDSNSFDLSWRDDFDTFDQTRWHKSSGTFEANSSVFHPQNVYTSGGNLVIKMEPLEHTIHDRHHEHYQRGHHGIRHMEEGHAVHDALPESPKEAKAIDQPQLGSLEPRTETKKPKTTSKQTKGKDQQKDVKRESHYLKAHEPGIPHVGDHEQRGEVIYHTDHRLHRELDHKYDDRHDVHPVHFHEHAVHKPFAADMDKADLNLSQATSQKGQAAPIKPVVVEKTEEVHDHDKHPMHLIPRIAADNEDETPFEHDVRRLHDSDAHFWATEHEPTLYSRLREHYEYSHHEEPHHAWKESLHGGPVHRGYDDHRLRLEPEHHGETLIHVEREPHHREHHADVLFENVDGDHAHHEATDLQLVVKTQHHEPIAHHDVVSHHAVDAHHEVVAPHELTPHMERAVKQAAIDHAVDHHEITHAAAHEMSHEIAHEEQHTLDHRFDDQRDVEPVHFHEHAVHRAFDHPDSHSYGYEAGLMHHGDFMHHEHVVHHDVDVEHHVEMPFLHDFLIQEPEHEAHHETFHGRERGYAYRPVAHHEGHLGHEVAETRHGVRHGETFGKAHAAEDQFEFTREMIHRKPGTIVHRDVVIEPIYDFEEPSEEVFIPVGHSSREVKYDMDGEGHVHMMEAENPGLYHYLQ